MSIYTIFTPLYSIFQHGYTALHIASFGNKRACIRLLISRGADSNIKDNKGKTALEVAGEYSYRPPEEEKEETRAVIRQALAERSASPSAFAATVAAEMVIVFVRNALDFACEKGDLSAVQGILAKYPKGHAPLLNYLDEVRTMGIDIYRERDEGM